MVSVAVMVDSYELDFAATERLASPAAQAFEDEANVKETVCLLCGRGKSEGRPDAMEVPCFIVCGAATAALPPQRGQGKRYRKYSSKMNISIEVVLLPHIQ